MRDKPVIDERRLPSLVVVTGPPGAGKTTLAHRLAPTVPCPLISRDEIKEGLQAANAGLVEEAAQRAAYEAFFSTLDLLLRRGVTVVAEAAFQYRLWVEPLTSLRQTGSLRIIVCSIPPDLALRRRIERMRSEPDRERFHPDPLVEAIREGRGTLPETYDPPHLSVPTLTVDTSDGYRPDFETLVAFAQATE